MNNSNPYALQLPQQPYRPPHEHPKKTSAGLIVGAILAVLVLIGVVSAGWNYFSEISSRKVADAKKLEQAFTGGKLSGCDLGDEFFGPTGWTDVENKGELGCSGYYDTLQGQIWTMLRFGRDTSDTPMEPATEDITGWEQSAYYSPENPVCVMRSDAPELAHVQLITKAPCKTLYSMAVQLNNLVVQYRGEKSDLTYMDATREPPYIAYGLYVEMIEYTTPLGTTQTIVTSESEGTLTVDDVQILYRPDEQRHDLCVHATFNTGPFSPGQTTVPKPGLTLIKPTGETTVIDYQVENKTYKEYEDVPLEGCINYTLEFRNAELLIGASNRINRDPLVTKSWSFRVGGDFGEKVVG
ncbi:hypothetical protein QP994_03295 [Corynebacterium sp. MSK044]|uniref:hypothetical protein n=1 Tax=Corynebacterium sp. MSK044 TaxID=3050195 RepID=UPI00254B02F6|nr:hypothetical protein [Corynebacterium sp. MSK044]MDK8796907.1 hypothetical protein [Corynebacterium sp. MSK044]